MRTVRWAVIAAMAVICLTAGTAVADPTFTPTATDIVVATDQTTQALCDAWSRDYVPTTGGRLACWDAVPPLGGSTDIQAKNNANCVREPRPNGSGADITELNKNVQTTGGNFCWDFAMVSRPITVNDGNVSSVALAEDGITYALNSTTNGVGNLTLAQLQAIYRCTAGATTWNGSLIGGSSADTIVPVLPQGNAGTRSVFLTDIGVSTPGSCVVNADGTQAIEENEGTDPVFNTGVDHNGVQHNTADEIWPYSIGVYISQVDKHTQVDVHGNAVLQSLKNARGVSEAPVLNPGTTNASINTAFPLLGTLFAVVRGPSVPPYLQGLLGNNDRGGWVCSNATAQADVIDMGFLNIADCGALTHF